MDKLNAMLTANKTNYFITETQKMFPIIVKPISLAKITKTLEIVIKNIAKNSFTNNE